MKKSASRRPLYDVLGLSSDCDVDQVTRAYRRLALQYHPDRNPDGADKFKAVSEAYEVLRDPARRRVYDATGEIAQHVESAESTAAHSAEMKDQIQRFFATYRESFEEEGDFVKQFGETNGNFVKMVKERLLFDNSECEESEVQRLYQLGRRLMATGVLPNAVSLSTSKWDSTTTPSQLKKLEAYLRREREEAQEALEEMGGDDVPSDLSGLQLMMQQRQKKEWDAMVSNMEDKYGGAPPARKRKIEKQHRTKKSKK